jgi:hypothetical protein
MAFSDSTVGSCWRIVSGKCERCGKKLAWSDRGSAGVGTWQAHHIDGNPNNDAITNCKILCGPCHERVS